MKEASDFVKKRDVNYTENLKQKMTLKPNKTFLKNTLRNVMSSNKSITKKYDTRQSRKTKTVVKKITVNKHTANEFKNKASKKLKTEKEKSGGKSVDSEKRTSGNKKSNTRQSS